MVFSAQHQFTPKRVNGHGILSLVMDASGYLDVASVGLSISFPCDQQRLVSVLERFWWLNTDYTGWECKRLGLEVQNVKT